MSCKCQECEKQYKVDIIVPDELWEKIKPDGKPKGGGMLCGSCIINRITTFDNYGTWELIKL